MAKDKKGFVLYADLIHTVEKLPDDKAGLLLKHLLRYVNDLDPVLNDLVVELTFEPIKQQLKRDLTHWESVRAQRSKAGKASADKRKQMSTHVESVEQKATNPTVIVKDTVTVKVKDIVKDNVIKKVNRRFTPPTLDQVQEYCLERKNKVDCSKFIDHYTSNGWKVGKNKMSVWKAAVRTWENNSFETTPTKQTNINVSDYSKVDPKDNIF